MIGCFAYGRSTELNVDNTEIEEAKWFSLEEIKLIIQNQHPDNITIPSERTIAHQLIKHWSLNSVSM
jgi:NAD+ diphosphatase